MTLPAFIEVWPSVDYSDMESGQSDIRNRVLAPVFKRLGIIEQWGNGLKIIKEELEAYPEIEFSWKEPGIAFRVSLRKRNLNQQQELQQELQQESLYGKVLNLVQVKTLSTQAISTALGQKAISGQLYATINKLKEDGLLEWTIPNKPKSSKQQYRITQKGRRFLEKLEKDK